MLRNGSIFLSGQPVSQGESSANASYVSRVPCGRFFIRRQGVGVMGGVGGGGGGDSMRGVCFYHVVSVGRTLPVHASP